jgi:hypothetical protein
MHPLRFPTLAALVALAGCAAGAGSAGSAGGGVTTAGYLHQYGLEVGQKLLFETEATGQIEMDSPMAMQIGMTFGSTLSFEPTMVGLEGSAGKLVLEDIWLETDMPEMAGMIGSQEFDQVRGKEQHLKLGPTGKPDRGDTSMEANMVGGGLGSLLDLPTMATYIFIPWPEYPIEPGATWADTTEVEMDQEGMNIGAETFDTFTYLGEQSLEVDGQARTVHAVKKKSETVTAGAGDMMEMLMSMTGTGTSEGTLYFDTMEGLLLLGKTVETVSMVMDMSGATSMSMTMQTSTETTIRRKPE